MHLPIYVIALDDSSRFTKLSTDLLIAELDFQKVTAINGKNLSESQVNDLANLESCKSRIGTDITKSQIACAMSHRNVYELFEKSNLEWALVLEEDVRLGVDFNHRLQNLLNDLNFRGPSVIQLFTRGERFVSQRRVQKFDSVQNVFKFASTPGQTAAYLINHDAAKKALADPKIDGPADWPNWSASVNFYCVYPFLVSENGSETTIQTGMSSTFQFRVRIFLIITGLHYLRYKKSYSSSSAYFSLVMRPILRRLQWRVTGRRTYPSNDASGLWLV